MEDGFNDYATGTTAAAAKKGNTGVVLLSFFIPIGLPVIGLIYCYYQARGANTPHEAILDPDLITANP